jgi:MYXO-CTERM domain-containing protein
MTIVVDDGCDDLDGDGFTNCGGDCDESDRTIFPGAPETCDGVDEDCDGTVDDSAVDATTAYRDSDGDGFGTASSPLASCSLPSGYATTAGDCDDTSASVRPGAAETCDGVDEDCDGTVDDSATDASTWYRDADADGSGSPSLTATGCSAPVGYVAASDDCDDGDARVSPSGTEACDAADSDEDCDGLSDDADPSVTGRSTYYEDGDGDGFGGGSSVLACDLPVGYASFSGDCADTDSRRYPGATESCSSTEDLNCDGSVGATDGDGDGFFACDDCDDGDRSIFPGATETCDGVDNDCDGAVDGSDEVTDGTSFYADADGDGFGDPSSTTTACSVPEGYAEESGDCDDADPVRFPAAAEVWYDGVDQDCDDNDADQDGDGFEARSVGGDDCDDVNAAVFPGAADAPYDGVDADCAGNDDSDADGDGFRSASQGGEDCDDSRSDVYPGAPDAPYDGVVTDCDASDENDADDDGFDAQAAGGEDCDDARSDVNPEAAEVWYDGVDQDCDGNDEDQDQDGTARGDDCDDTDASVAAVCGPEDEVLDGETFGEGEEKEKEGCGCASAPASGGGGLAALLGLLGFFGLRRRP